MIMKENAFFKNKVVLINSIMSVVVVFLHSYNIERYENIKWGITAQIEYFISKTIGNLAVPLFFLLSSILFFQNYNWDKVRSKYESRIKSILIPYLIWNVFHYFCFAILTRIPISSFFMDTKVIPIDAKTLFDAVFFHQYNGVYWFMYQLILLIVISPIIYFVMRGRYSCFVPIALVIIYYWIETIPACENALRVDSLIYWVIGAYLGIRKKERIYSKSKYVGVYVILSVLFVFLRFCLEFMEQPIKISIYCKEILLIINVIAVWFAFDLFEIKNVYPWMKMSFFVYSAHQLVTDTLKKGISVLLPDNDVMALTNYVVTGVGTVFLCIMLAQILINFAPRFYYVISGGRGQVTISKEHKK